MAQESEAAAFNLDNTGVAFGLVFAAGLSTAVGAAAVFERRIVKFASKQILAIGLGFSAGVMLYVSFIEIFFKSFEAFLEDDREEKDAYVLATICLFAGMVLLRLLQYVVHRIDGSHNHCSEVLDGMHALEPPLITPRNRQEDPEAQTPGETTSATEGGPSCEGGAASGGTQPVGELAADEATAAAVVLEKAEAKEQAEKAKKLQQMGLNTAIAIAIHNFPEGLATFVATLVDPSVGATLAIAIGVHNIPEGLCVALPIYYSTQSRMKGFLFGVLSGISEPVGAFIGWLIIKSTGDDMSQLVYGILFGLVAGMMIMICILELLPTAFSFDPKDKYVTNSTMGGMAVMAASLVLFKL